MTVTLLEYLLLIFFAVSLAIAIGMVLIKHRQTFDLGRLFNSAQWVSLPATIEYASVEEIVGETIHYYQIVKYRYEYAGLSYVSSTIDSALIEGMCSNQAISIKLLSLFPSGTVITAFIDKNVPSTAVLSLNDVLRTPSMRIWNYGLIYFFAAFGLFSLIIYIVYFLSYPHAS